jgi:hypothetical protein
MHSFGIMQSRAVRWFAGMVVSLLGLYLLLLIPDPATPVRLEADRKPFAWNRDAYWSSLESRFREARAEGCANLSSAIAWRLSRADSFNVSLQTTLLPSAAPGFGEAESNFFELGVLTAACPAKTGDYMRSFGELWHALNSNLSVGI